MPDPLDQPAVIGAIEENHRTILTPGPDTFRRIQPQSRFLLESTVAGVTTRLENRLHVLEIVGIDDPNGGSVTSFFPVEDFVMLAPEVPHGDFNRDGVLSELDIDLLTSAVASDPSRLEFDLNGDPNLGQLGHDGDSSATL